MTKPLYPRVVKTKLYSKLDKPRPQLFLQRDNREKLLRIIFQIGRIFFQLFQKKKKKCSKREQERRSIPSLDPPTGIRSDCNFRQITLETAREEDEGLVWSAKFLQRESLISRRILPSPTIWVSREEAKKKKEKKACRVNSVRTPPFENIAATIHVLRVFIRLRVGPALDLFALVIRNFTRPSVHTLASFDNPFISTLLVSFRPHSPPPPPFFLSFVVVFFPHAREISRWSIARFAFLCANRPQSGTRSSPFHEFLEFSLTPEEFVAAPRRDRVSFFLFPFLFLEREFRSKRLLQMWMHGFVEISSCVYVHTC